MNDLIVKLYNKVFKSTDALTVVEVLVLHYHYAYTKEPFHTGIMEKVGIDAPHLQDIYHKLIENKLLDADYNITSKGKKVINGQRVAKNTRDDWFEKFWKMYPIKIGKKKSKEIFMKLKFDEEMFKFVYNSLVKQLKYKDFMDRQDKFYPHFKHCERWLRNEEWDNEVPDINQTKIVNLNRK
tara:strand:- start:2767 stop:3312 length:546 start_codon:yes stop_codon:yes gene_type:complete